jgi:hypothetical protein
MTDVDDRPTIAERYGLAATAGAPSDIIAAAGMQSSRLGAMLLRLQAEYDGVRVALERAGQIRPRGIQQAHDLRKEAQDCIARSKAPGIGVVAESLERRAAVMLAEAERIEEQRTPGEIVSARAFILVELKTLRETKLQVGVLAIKMAKRRGVDPEAAMKLAGRVLDVYLDPICHHCDGTGLIGSNYRGDSGKECDKCKSSGSRRDILGNQLAETMLAADLAAELDRQAKDAARRISAALAFSAEPASTQTNPELRERLAELRSLEAERD